MYNPYSQPIPLLLIAPQKDSKPPPKSITQKHRLNNFCFEMYVQIHFL